MNSAYILLFILGLTLQSGAAVLMTHLVYKRLLRDRVLWHILMIVLWLKTLNRVAVIPVVLERNDIDLLVVFVAQFLPAMVAALLFAFVIRLYRNAIIIPRNRWD